MGPGPFAREPHKRGLELFSQNLTKTSPWPRPRCQLERRSWDEGPPQEEQPQGHPDEGLSCCLPESGQETLPRNRVNTGGTSSRCPCRCTEFPRPSQPLHGRPGLCAAKLLGVALWGPASCSVSWEFWQIVLTPEMQHWNSQTPPWGPIRAWG